MSSPPNNAGQPPRRPGLRSEESEGGREEFDPDAVLAELRAQEAMEVLRRRERAGRGLGEEDGQAGGAPLGSDPGPSLYVGSSEPVEADGSTGADRVCEGRPADDTGGLPPAQWTTDGRWSEIEALPHPAPADERAMDDDDEEGGAADSDLDTSPPLSGPEEAARVEVDPSDPRFETDEDPRIPTGQESFRIGEVARIIGVKPHVLRFWETEFEWVEPEKTSTNQRRYRRCDVSRLLQIRRLRHDAHLTLAQTRTYIEEALRTGQTPRLMPSPASALNGAEVDAIELKRRLADMRRAVVELLEAVEDGAE